MKIHIRYPLSPEEIDRLEAEMRQHRADQLAQWTDGPIGDALRSPSQARRHEDRIAEMRRELTIHPLLRLTREANFWLGSEIQRSYESPDPFSSVDKLRRVVAALEAGLLEEAFALASQLDPCLLPTLDIHHGPCWADIEVG